MIDDPRLPERFWAKVSPEPNTGCWLWTASLNGGYGWFGFDGRPRMAHRVAYETLVGPVPAGLECDHLCRVRCCVNPEHLEPVTSQENSRRGDSGKHWAAKTHCPQGHEYTGTNLRVYRGKRNCRECHRAAVRVFRAKGV